jgi:hypothetical protein
MPRWISNFRIERYNSAMPLQDRYPDVSDEQIYSELFSAGRQDEEALREVFTPGMLALAATIGDFVTESANNDTLQIAAHYHPVNHNIPYTTLPPSLLQPANETTQAQLQAYLEQHDAKISGDNGLDDRKVLHHEKFGQAVITEIFSSNGSAGISSEQWSDYTQSHVQEHGRDFCSLVFTAADVARRKMVQDGRFVKIERYLIDRYLSYQYPASLTQTTSCPQRTLSYIRMPKSREIDDAYSEQLIRAAGFIMDWAGVDKGFERNMMSVAEEHADLVDARMLRILDQPIDELRAPVRSIQEGVGRAILPVVAELLRSSVHSSDISGKLVAQITRLAPLGYAGPAGLQGVGLGDPLANLDNRGTLRVSNEAQASFRDMQTYWRRYYHYPVLKMQEVDSADKRTGIGCPFAVPMRSMPNVISAFADVVLLVASKIDDRSSPAYDEVPYRPGGISQLLEQKTQQVS